MDEQRKQFEAWAREHHSMRNADWFRDSSDLADDLTDSWAAWQAATAWCPIESAPKDGTYVLLWCPTHIHNDAMPFTGRWFSGGPWIIINTDMAIQRVEPSHWQPLPSPPIRKG